MDELATESVELENRRSPPPIEARDVTMNFRGVTALDSVTFVANEGNLTGLVGPNGAGKTTLFGVLSGLLRPQAGQVFIGGKDVTSLGPERRARMGLARTFQRVELFAEMTVRDHLSLAFRVNHRSTNAFTDFFSPTAWKPDREEREWIDSLLLNLGLHAVADLYATNLPLGTTRLVEVGRALAARPDVLLLDEPTSGLDTGETQHLAATLLKTKADHRVTMVFVEHNVDLIFGICDYVYVLDFGRIIAQGTSTEVRSNPRVQDAYIGTVPL